MSKELRGLFEEEYVVPNFDCIVHEAQLRCDGICDDCGSVFSESEIMEQKKEDAYIQWLESKLSKAEPKSEREESLIDMYKKRADLFERKYLQLSSKIAKINKPSSNTESKGAEEFLKKYSFISESDDLDTITFPFDAVVVFMQLFAKQAVEKAEQRMKEVLPHFLCVHCYEDKDAINEAKEEFLTHIKNKQ